MLREVMDITFLIRAMGHGLCKLATLDIEEENRRNALRCATILRCWLSISNLRNFILSAAACISSNLEFTPAYSF